MKGTTILTVARVAALALAGLALLAAADTAILVAHTLDEVTTGRVVACLVSAAVTAALGFGAVRMWRRGATPPDGPG